MMFYPFGPSGGGDMAGAISELAGNVNREFEVRRRAMRLEEARVRDVELLFSILGTSDFMKYLFDIRNDPMIKLPVVFGDEEIRLMIDPKDYMAKIYGVLILPGEIREVGEVQLSDMVPEELKGLGYVLRGELMDHRCVVRPVVWRELNREYFVGKANLVIKAIGDYSQSGLVS